MKKVNHKVLVIVGPTASGKTKLAVQLARRFNGEIVSADSRQVYRGMDIGTGKDLQAYGPVLRHLIDVASPRRQFTVADYQRLAYRAIDDIISRGKLPIVCGGTGLYVSAVTEGYVFPENQKSKIKNQKLGKELNKLNLSQLLTRLKKIDQATYKVIDKKNRRRVQRALEIYYQTGQTKSAQISKRRPPYDFLFLGLSLPKAKLQQRINHRLMHRLNKENMVREVARLHRQGLSWQRLDDFGLEYRFISRYLRHTLSYPEMVRQLEKATEQFAKRQMTWFKRNKSIRWVDSANEARAAAERYIAER